MKKSHYVAFLVIFCPTCCNISSDLNIFFPVSYAGKYAEQQSYLLKDKKKSKRYLVFYCFISCSFFHSVTFRDIPRVPMILPMRS